MVIGANGRIGSAMCKELAARKRAFIGTTRQTLDVTAPGVIPPCDVAYLCAAQLRTDPAIAVPDEWAINVDGTIEVAKRLHDKGAFVVFLSSRAVESRNDEYTRMKKIVEKSVDVMDGAIVRLATVNERLLPDAVNTLLAVGDDRIKGLTVWGQD